MQKPYPSTWPKPNHRSKFAVVNRITEQQKLDLYNRAITTRDLATQLEVKENYLSKIFPGKVEPLAGTKADQQQRRELIVIRKAFRLEKAMEVVNGKLTVMEASEVVHTSYRNMARLVQHVRPKP